MLKSLRLSKADIINFSLLFFTLLNVSFCFFHYGLLGIILTLIFTGLSIFGIWNHSRYLFLSAICWNISILSNFYHFMWSWLAIGLSIVAIVLYWYVWSKHTSEVSLSGKKNLTWDDIRKAPIEEIQSLDISRLKFPFNCEKNCSLITYLGFRNINVKYVQIETNSVTLYRRFREADTIEFASVMDFNPEGYDQAKLKGAAYISYLYTTSHPTSPEETKKLTRYVYNLNPKLAYLIHRVYLKSEGKKKK